MKPRTFALTLLLCALVALPLCAADKPNFTGTWKLNVEKSDLGQEPVSKLVAVVDHKDPVFKHEVTGEAGDGQPFSETLEFTIDGKEHPSDLAGGGKLTASWDGPVLVLKFVSDGGFKFDVRLSLQSDGKTCVRDFVMTGPNGEMKRHEIYEKQPAK